MKKPTIAEPREEKPSASIRIGKKLDFPELSIGKTVSVTLTGKITNISDEEWNRGFSMQVTALEKDDDMGEAMTRSKRSRSMMDLDELDED